MRPVPIRSTVLVLLASSAFAIAAAGEPRHSVGPPVAASEVREDALRLLNSLHDAGDFTAENVRRQTGEVLREDGMSSDGVTPRYRSWAQVRHGWTYGYSLSKPKSSDLSASIDLGLVPERAATRERRASCTLAFEPFAKRLEDLGYRRYPPASQGPALTRNTLHMPFRTVFRRSAEHAPLVAIGVYHYPPERPRTANETCLANIAASLQSE